MQFLSFFLSSYLFVCLTVKSSFLLNILFFYSSFTQELPLHCVEISLKKKCLTLFRDYGTYIYKMFPKYQRNRRVSFLTSSSAKINFVVNFTQKNSHNTLENHLFPEKKRTLNKGGTLLGTQGTTIDSPDMRP